MLEKHPTYFCKESLNNFGYSRKPENLPKALQKKPENQII